MTEPNNAPHRLPFFGMLAVCLLTLVLRILDLAFFTDPATGFVTNGFYFARIALPLVAVALSYLASGGVARRPRALLGPCTGLGICLLLLTAALAATALLSLPELLFGSVTALIGAVAALLSALWPLLWGVRALGPLPAPTRTLPPTLAALPGPAFFLWTMINRFAVAPASVMRLGCTLGVLSAAAALLFLAMVLRVFLTPGLPVGHAVFAAGMIAFMLCTCHELPQTVFAFFHGGATMAELAASLAMGLWGVAGLVCAWYATGEGLHLLPDHMYSRKK